MTEFHLLQSANRFTLNVTAIKTKLLQFFKQDYDSYLTFTDHESRYML